MLDKREYVHYIVLRIFSHGEIYMPKEKKERSVRFPPPAAFYRPIGIPSSHMGQVVLSLDEYEALRLVDYEGMDQADASVHLGVSRPTCARILESARRKLAEMLVNGSALKIEGGSYRLRANRFRCFDCGSMWETEIGAAAEENPQECPHCGSRHLANLAERAGWRHRGRPGPSARGPGGGRMHGGPGGPRPGRPWKHY